MSLKGPSSSEKRHWLRNGTLDLAGVLAVFAGVIATANHEEIKKLLSGPPEKQHNFAPAGPSELRISPSRSDLPNFAPQGPQKFDFNRNEEEGEEPSEFSFSKN